MEVTLDESDVQELELSWDDPTTVSFDFIKTGKSKGDGILTTNDNSFKLHYNKSTKGGQLQHYVCSHKKQGCQARALIQRIETEDEAGNKTVQRTLLSVSSPLVHSRNHQPDQAQITADLLVSKMKEEVKILKILCNTHCNLHHLQMGVTVMENSKYYHHS